MDKFKDYEKLVGYSYVTGQEKVIPNTLEDVADYIVREGLKGDVMIIATDNTPVLNTMGLSTGVLIPSIWKHSVLF